MSIPNADLKKAWKNACAGMEARVVLGLVMTRDDLLKLREEINREYESHLAAINQLLRWYDKSSSIEPTLKGLTPQPANNGQQSKSVFAAVKEAIQFSKGKFTLKEIAQEVKKERYLPTKSTTVASALHRLK